MGEKKPGTREKILQYGMTVLLLSLAFLLPACGARQQKNQRLEAGETGAEADSPEQAAENPENSGIAASDSGTEGQTAESGETAEKSSFGTQASGQTIVLDPGHGGNDPGMTGASGISEKVLNLIYAKKLAALLEAEGFRVVLTRTTEDGLYDEGVSNKKAQDMQRRCAMIAEEQPVLTVSIHQNSYAEDASVRGPQVFYYEQSAEGEKLAAAIQDSLNTSLAIERPRQQKGNASYYILKRSASVTVIVECGFLTNPEEEALLQQESYQDQVAKAICAGVMSYLQTEA